ncbi:MULTISPECIES: succinylglutamate desuccinylase/aspartoacylase family protein [Neptuniibacter]|jgi:predicted deacylase|uniref:succinylglutamate desuccinylase/aspartoacylase family protein n=1 Tax=Neptuniibacter TaxID=459520 RepID=UPI000835C9A9|nr:MULTISPECIES: succinylglutamate desuccinylase/aspartoacylase family protein [Neptuniibacter]MDO6593570.1 succinylglutamate desuccinylase/aspartoacylase family protein [Neptuniibacter sp. 1_MG-2023]
MADTTFTINGTKVAPGTRTTIELPAGRLYTHTPMTIPVHVINGKRDGPRLFLSAAIHGDEINGVEIIRRVLTLPALKRIKGTLIAVPIVNVHGLLSHSRYLPDRRDLNRSFPGSEKGSLAARIAHLFMEEIVCQSTHGIDLHTGAVHRTNLPQIRANLDDEETDKLARAFNVPVIISSNLRDGSLREAAAEHGIPMLLYEAGEALRFDEMAIRAGVKGIVNVMRSLGMLPPSRGTRKSYKEPVVARSSSWVRASESGILRALIPLGGRVSKGTLLGVVSDPFGEKEAQITSPYSGIVIGKTNLPLVNEGDALYHIARFGDIEEIEAKVDEFQEDLSDELNR